MMRRRFSYADQKNHFHRARRIAMGALFFLLLYSSVSSLFFSVRVLENDTMGSNLRSGERFIFSSYGFYYLIPGLGLEKGFRRGNVVLINTYAEQPEPIYLIMDGALRFFTAQNFSLVEKKDHLFVKRVIGLPGDEISMTNFIIRVKVKGSAYSLTEMEVSEQDYTPEIPQMPALWDASLPFSGNMDSIVLGENEFFVLCDDRSNTNDSRTWGPVQLKNISGNALFRFWPLTRVGRP
jgi:signal peptidase I